MIATLRTTAAALLGVVCIFGSQAQERQGFDVVTMHNGDIFTGNLALDRFDIATGYGQVSIPRQLVLQVYAATDRPGFRLSTLLGDRFGGTLQQRELTMTRVLDPPLPLDLAEITEIRIAPGNTQHREILAPDTVETTQGDLFAARIISKDLLLKTSNALKLISLDDLHILEFAPSDGGPMTQVTLNGGDILQGRLLTETIQVQSRYGDKLEIPSRDLLSIGVRVNFRHEDGPRWNYRKQVPQASLFQDRMRDGSLGPEMVVVRGGRYIRGDSQGDPDEQYLQDIQLQPFAIGVYEVTFEEYQRFVESSHREHPADEGWGRGRRPVINVSWDSAVAFAEWLSLQTGEIYRLPTDAEWEYAARGGSRLAFWWGDEVGIAKANCAGCGSLWDGEKSSPVGRFMPNPFGLHDTAGNVFEWVADCWNNSFADTPIDGSAYVKPDCGVRVIRGGAWSFPPKEARSGNRWRNFRSRRSDDTGFRIVRELPSR